MFGGFLIEFCRNIKPESLSDEQNPKPNPSKISNKQMVSLSFEMGFIIALPLIVFGMVGKWLDQKYGTDNLFVLVGIALALAASTYWLYKKLQQYIK